MASNGSGRGIIGTVASFVAVAAIIYALYYAFGGSPESMAEGILRWGTAAWDFITRLVRSLVDAGQNR